MIARKPIPRKRAKPRKGPTRDPKYLAFIRKQPCVACMGGAWLWPVEAAHIGVRGLGQKSSDLETIPLCAYHHRDGSISAHTLGKRFWKYHGLDKAALIAKYNRMFEAL